MTIERDDSMSPSGYRKPPLLEDHCGESLASVSQPTPQPWRQILTLGERLVEQTTLAGQRDLIVHTSEELLHCQAQLWLASLPEMELSPTPLMQQALDQQRICCQGGIFPPAHKSSKRRKDNSLQMVAIPILTQDTPLGALQVQRPAGQPFSEEELALLDGLALQSALALQTTRQVQLERWRVEQLSLVRQVSAQIATVLDVDELARRVTALILDTFQYYYVAIFTLGWPPSTAETGPEMLRFRASAGPRRPEGIPAPPPEETPTPAGSLLIQKGVGLIGLAAQTGQEMLAEDVQVDSRYRYLETLSETRSEVALPLTIGSGEKKRVLGVLDVQSNLPRAFQETDMLVLRALADSIAIAIEDARLYGALRQRAGQLASVAEVSNALASILDLDELLQEVVALLHKRLGYPFVQIFLVHPGRRKIFYYAGSIPTSRQFQREEFGYDLDDLEGLIPWTARHGETALVNNTAADPRYRPAPPEFEFTAQSELVVPLVFGGEVLGILDIESDQRDAFSNEDRFLLEALADNIAIAIHNASLYRSEQWRRQVADGMREVAGLLSADADLDQVLDAILTELDRTLPCEVSAIWLLEEMDIPSESLPAGEPTRLHLAAVHCRENDSCPESVIGDENGMENPWLIEALQTSEPIVRREDAPFEPLGRVLEYPADYSAIAAPLRIGERAVGVLTLAHPTRGRYGSEACAMTATFASYAAVAIENTRLYEASHEQAWIATVLLQVAEATQSISDINELLATVARITPMLVSVRSCALFLWDVHAQVFIPAAAHGLNEAQRAEFEQRQVAVGEFPGFDTLLDERRAVVVSDLFGVFESVVLFPLMAHGDVLGALLVDFSAAAPEMGGADFLYDEKLAIVQGIVHQTAIAVENIRLLRSQKEEAYVSVALLQVAQAIVSMNDLHDILGAIVRITPILVGVKRSAIFLWDEERHHFRMEQSYGIPREMEDALLARTFCRGEFPLLDAVCPPEGITPSDSTYPHGHMAFYILLGQESPVEWEGLTPLTPQALAPSENEAETGLAEAGLNEALDLAAMIVPADILRTDERLLMAFPLSVKGKALGVMIVEEADPLDGEGEGKSLGEASARHLRERRLEIITGITQQASLAIQNDLLQSEVVERERLERELQLAREIQKTFLPHDLPRIKRFDLDVRWRPARQVGGDFYDLFRLPNGRLGLVIADVADKGMPAALFMTLVRTLVRAAVHAGDPPSKVLERVNKLLTPDSQQGMFVTILYAVLTPTSGELAYANAGHNLPLVYRGATQEVEILRGGGTALGILDTVRLKEYHASLEPGDVVMFYTDGVTDAISPSEEMYGDERLHATLRANGDRAARDLLDAVDQSIEAFTHASYPFDDITMIALKRLS